VEAGDLERVQDNAPRTHDLGLTCARRSELGLDGGRATIFGGYGDGRCPKSEPDHWLAHVYLDGVVVTVNMAYCYACGGRPASDPYNSRGGLEAVVRGLRRR
jgi:hypothetical protein